MKSFVNDCGEVAHVAHKIIVLDAGASDADRVNFLKGVRADERQWHLPCDNDNRSRIHVSVGDARHGVGCTGAGCNERHADPPRRARVTFGHVNRALFMSH